MGIFAGGKAARASGGISTTTVGPYTVHAFTTTGANTFTPTTTGFVDILLVGAGGAGGNGYGAGGGGAGATLFKKMIPVVAGTPYPINVGTGGPVPGSSGIAGNGAVTTFTYAGITTTAYGGGGGYGAHSYANSGAGNPAPNASGGGAAARNTPPTNPIGGIGANIYGVGYPGGGGPSGAGGGAGGAGGGYEGGPGVPIAYFTGNPSHIASIGGYGGGDGPGPWPTTPSMYAPFNFGHGGRGMSSPAVGSPGVAYIRYI